VKRHRLLLPSRFYSRRIRSVGAHKSKVRLDRSFVLLLQSTSTTQDYLDTSIVESFTLIRIRTQK